MNHTACIIGLIVATLAWSLAPLPATADEPDPAVVARWVRQLDADDITDRLAAEAALLELGPAILPLLPEAAEAPNPQVARSLTEITRKLEQRQTAAFTAASTITLAGDDLPLDRVMAALGEQSDCKIVDMRQRFGQVVTEPRLAVAWENTPFWEALDDLLDQAALELYPFAGEGQLGVLNRSPEHRPMAEVASTSGPFRVVGHRLQIERQLGLTGPGRMTADLNLLWEPRLRPVVVYLDQASLTAQDDRGQDLPIPAAEADLEIPVDGSDPTLTVRVNLAAPERAAKQLARLSGQLRAVVPGLPHTFAFEQVQGAAGKAQRRGNVEVVLDQIREPIPGIWEFRVRVRIEEDETGVESHRNWVLQNPVELLDPNGQPVASAGIETTLRREREFGVAYFFQAEKGVAGHTLRYTSPVSVVVQTIPFELKDLPLP